MTAARATGSSHLPLLEAFEPRMLLDAQIGTVAMPFDGYLSAAVYDSSGQLVRTLMARSPQDAGSISLMWDGKDDLGRAVFQDGTYSWRALVSQVETVDQGGVGDSLFNPDITWPDGEFLESNDHVDAVAVNVAGGVFGDAGGTFARNISESSFGDISLSQSFTLNDAIGASGMLNVSPTDLMTTDGEFFVGHYSFSTAGNRREFIGMEFKEGPYDGSLEARARMYRPDGNGGNGAMSNLLLVPTTGQVFFEYSYDPTFEADPSHDGPEGRVTLRITNGLGYDQTVEAVLEGGHRDGGATFDAFGMGIAAGAVSDSNPARTAKLYIDDVTYSGNVGVVNFETDAGWTGVGNNSDGNSYGLRQVDLDDGSFFTASYAEEGIELRRHAPDGSPIVERKIGGTVGFAVAGKYVFLSQRINDQDQIMRLLVTDLTDAPFLQTPGGIIVINDGAYDSRPAGQSRYTPDQYRMQYSTWGIAADSRRILISNYRFNRVEVYDAQTGANLGQFAADKPIGLAVEADGANSGAVWVANSGNRVSRFTYRKNAQGVYVFTEDVSRRISGLAEPSGLSIGGPDGHLFISELASGKVREYDIASSPGLAGLANTFGSYQKPGPVGDDEFYFVRWAGIAVGQDGILNVVDDRRVQRFYTQDDPAAGVSAGDLYQTMWGEFAGMPIDMYGYGPGGTHTLVSGAYEYEVDPEYTGGPRDGWMGDGSWRLVARYYNQEAPSVYRTLSDGMTQRQFRVSFMARDTVLWAMEPSGTRMSAIVGAYWTGTSRMETSNGGQYNWTDSDGDGTIDWDSQNPDINNGEVTWNVPLGQDPLMGGYSLQGGWMDEQGSIWHIVNGAIVKVQFEGFDAGGNPVYNWANAVTVVPPQDDQWDFTPRFVRTAANGDIYALGATKYNGNLDDDGNSEIHGGNWIARYDSNGNRLGLYSAVDAAPGMANNPPAMAFDENDPNSQYYFLGHGEGFQHYIRMLTNDGLVVARAFIGDAGGNQGGWIDHQYGIGAFTHPITGKTYMYGEEVWYGKSERYRVDGLDTIQRQEGSFQHTAVRTADGHWQFEDNLADSAGTSTGTFVGGTAGYVTGVAGKAIQLDGQDDYIELPLDLDQAAYTISLWVKPADASGVNILSQSSAAGGNYYQLRINGSGKFEHWSADTGNPTVVGSTAVQSNTWYHLAIVATNGGMMRLYVNGQEAGAAVDAGSIAVVGDRFRIGNAIGQWGFFSGLVDDLQIYDVPLTGSEIQAVYAQVATVSVSTSDAVAAEQGADTGSFTINRNGTSGNLTVNYTVSGSATSGSDYSALAGFAVIPNGQSSVNVIVTPIDDAVIDAGEAVIITISASLNYVITAPASATLTITDNDASGDPGWSGIGNTSDGNSYGWSYNTSNAGGVMGEIGGTISRNANETYYADTNLSQAYSLDSMITASGKLTVFGQVNTDQEWILGHITSTVGDSTILGIEFMEDSDGSFKFKARASAPDATGVEGEFFGLPNGDYSFEYTYDPSVGEFGRLTVRLYNGAIDYTSVADLDSNVRLCGAAFDAFGMGTKYRPGTGSDPNKLIQMYIDDLSYSGSQAPPTVSVAAADGAASEQGADTGAFTISRNTSSGNLTVYYAMSGTAGSGTDYSAMSGSVVIADGQTSADVVLTPLDDLLAESSETAVLTIVAGGGYLLGMPNAASVAIADNEPLVWVLASDARAAEQGSGTGKFTVARSNTNGNVTVNYVLGGSAVNGSDYSLLSGWVVIPSGQMLAYVTVTPIDDAVLDPSESVTLTLQASSSYTITSPSSDVLVIIDNDAAGDPGWLGMGNASDGNSYGWSAGTNYAGGAAGGEIGGTFARNDGESYYADDALSQTFTLNNTITASGKLTIFGQQNTDQNWILGHISTSLTDRSTIGIEFMESDNGSVRMRARMVGVTDSAETEPVGLINGVYDFEYTYDPGLGSNGRLTLHVFNATYNHMIEMNLSSGDRASGATFDAFGIGILAIGSGSDDPNRTVKMYVDDLSYSGYQPGYAGDQGDVVAYDTADLAPTTDESATSDSAPVVWAMPAGKFGAMHRRAGGRAAALLADLNASDKSSGMVGDSAWLTQWCQAIERSHKARSDVDSTTSGGIRVDGRRLAAHQTQRGVDNLDSWQRMWEQSLRAI